MDHARITEPSPPPRLLDAACAVDGRGDLSALEDRVRRLTDAGLDVATLTIDTLRDPWLGDPPRTGTRFQSGCGPLLALEHGAQLIAGSAAHAVVVRGAEPLRTGYASAERRQLMRVYGELSIPEAYTRLARLQMDRLDVDEAGYRRLCDSLLANYRRTAARRGLPTHSPHGQRPATSLFTFADCANPNVDFEGAVLLGGAQAAQALDIDMASMPALRGVAVELGADGPEHLESIVGFASLGRVFRAVCDAAKVDFVARFLRGEALLEAYTCFPPAPLGLLSSAGLAKEAAAMAALLEQREITVTGGMNLAGAPWHNPVLHALIVLWQRLTADDAPRLGLVHGNGGLGGYQGVALISAGAG